MIVIVLDLDATVRQCEWNIVTFERRLETVHEEINIALERPRLL